VTVAHVLDASAVLAWLQEESGEATVDPVLTDSAISAVNWSEVLQKVAQKGHDAGETADLLKALGMTILEFTEEDALAAAALWTQAPALSLGDRSCLALARRLGVPALTADRSWSSLPVGVTVILIR
jgi:PIN domain nuclease of toxin-antitoxin system